MPAALAGFTASLLPAASLAATVDPTGTEAAPLTHQFFLPALNRSGGSPARIAQELRERQERLLRLAFPERFPQSPTDPRQQSPLLPVIDAPVPVPYRAPAPPSISQTAAKQTEREAVQQSRSLADLAARGSFDRLFEPPPGAGLAGITVLPGAPTRAGPFTAFGY